MPVLNGEMGRILNSAFRLTSGAPLGEMYRDPRFLDKLSARRSLFGKYSAADYLGSLLRVVPFLAIARVSHLFQNEIFDPLVSSTPAFEETMDESGLVALLELLGEAIVDEAAKVLPRESLDLIPEFRSSDATGQAGVLRQLQSILSSKGQVRKAGELHSSAYKFMLDDLEGQPISRVVPRKYGRYSNGGNPNCFGKGQMLVAWARLAGAKVIGATPIVTAHSHVSPFLTGVTRMLLANAIEHGITLHMGLLGNFAYQQELQANYDEMPEAFHMAAIVQLKDGSWYLVDPHMRACGPLSSQSWALEWILPKLELYQAILPGLSLYGSDFATPQVRLNQLFKKAVAPAELALQLVNQWKTRARMRFSGCFSLFLSSPVAETLAQARGFLDSHSRWFLEDILSGKREFNVARDITWAGCPAGEQEAVTRRMTVGLLVLDLLSEFRLLARARGASLESSMPYIEEAMMKALSSLFAVAYSNCRNMFETEADEESGIIHPAFEFYNPNFRIGVEMVSHFNARLKNSSEGVVASLGRLCGGQLHQLALATSPLRNGGAMSHEAELAAKLLQYCPVQYRVVKKGLSLLAEEGWLKQEGEPNGT